MKTMLKLYDVVISTMKKFIRKFYIMMLKKHTRINDSELKVERRVLSKEEAKKLGLE